MKSMLFLLIAVVALAGCADPATTHLTIEYPDGTTETHDVAFDSSDTPTEERFQTDGQAHPGNHTALDQLETAEVAYETQLSAFGYFVTTIGGAGPGENAFWKLVVNGEDAQLGAGFLVLQEDDDVLWTVETFTPAGTDLTVEVRPAVLKTVNETVPLTVALSTPATVEITRGNETVRTEDVQENSTFNVSLDIGPNTFVVTADDGTTTTVAETTVTRLAQATVQIRYNDYPGREDRDDEVFFDVADFASAPMYDDVAMAHPGNETVHDVMVAWENSTGVPVTYAFDDQVGYSITHIDDAGNPVSSSAPPYWCYTMNGEAADYGISSMPISHGDVILWDLGSCGFVPA